MVCEELGSYGGTVYPGSFFGQGTGPIWMDQVSCYGSEWHLSHCEFGGWGNHDCMHVEDVGVVCGSKWLTIDLLHKSHKAPVPYPYQALFWQFYIAMATDILVAANIKLTLPDLCEGNPSIRFGSLSQTANDADLWCFVGRNKVLSKQTSYMMIWGVITLMSL